MNYIYKIPAFPRHLLILIVSVLFQLCFYNYIHISHYFNIFFYLFFILTLPVKIKRLLLLAVCAVYGLLMDLLLSTGGIFMMTTTFIGYIRPAIIRLFFVRDERYSNTIPTSSDMGVVGFIIYSFIIVFVATLFFSIVENFSFTFIGRSVVESLLSAVFTLPFIFLAQLLLIRGRER